MDRNIRNGLLEIQSEACDQLGLQQEGSASKSPAIQQVGAKLVDEAKTSSQPSNGKRGRPRKGKNTLRTLVGSARVLHARSQEKCQAPEQINGSAEDAVSRRKRRKKKKQRIKEVPNDEFSKIRRHLRYFLTRINYEQNLIDAYSGEGWKGQRSTHQHLKIITFGVHDNVSDFGSPLFTSFWMRTTIDYNISVAFEEFQPTSQTYIDMLNHLFRFVFSDNPALTIPNFFFHSWLISQSWMDGYEGERRKRRWRVILD